MDKTNEISKVQSLLKIPVSDLLFNPTNVEVISGRVNIGGIPYYNVAGILSYDTAINVVNWLNWTEIYNQNKSDIDAQIVELVGTDKIVIGYGTFRNLYIRNQDGDLLCVVTCAFDNGWTVAKQ